MCLYRYSTMVLMIVYEGWDEGLGLLTVNSKGCSLTLPGPRDIIELRIFNTYCFTKVHWSVKVS